MTFFPDKVVVGLTGSIASGKSTSLAFFNELGWATTSTDDIVSDLWARDENLLRQVRNRWGSEKIFCRGNIDKSEIARIIFKSPVDRSWLESTIHPIVRNEWVSRVRRSEFKHHVIEVPLLFENDLSPYFQKIISVHVPKTVQLSRLLERNLSSENAAARISAQLPSWQKARDADYVLLGSGDVDFLQRQVQTLSKRLIP